MPKVSRTLPLYGILLQLLAFTLPLPFIYGSVSVALLCLGWVATAKVRQSPASLKQRPALWPWLLFFLLHVISFFYSTDRDKSLFDITSKLSFLLLPIVIGTAPLIERRLLGQVFGAFISGLSFVATVCLLKASYYWIQDGTTGQFFYHSLVQGFEMNAVYYAWYTLFGLSLLLLYPFRRGLLARRPWRLAALMLLGIFFVLLSSRLLLVLFVILLLPAVLVRQWKRPGRSRLPVALAALGIVSCCLLVAITRNPVSNRFREVMRNNSASVWMAEDPGKQHFNNLTLRFFLWKTALENIEEHRLWLAGCGNGDVALLQKDKIAEYRHRLNPHDLKDPELWRYNLHNMYLQSLMMLGLPGLICFLLMVGMPVFFSRKTKEAALFLVFHTAACLFMLQESALQTQAGIIFFTFWTMIGWNLVYGRQQQQPGSL